MTESEPKEMTAWRVPATKWARWTSDSHHIAISARRRALLSGGLTGSLVLGGTLLFIDLRFLPAALLYIAATAWVAAIMAREWTKRTAFNSAANEMRQILLPLRFISNIDAWALASRGTLLVSHLRVSTSATSEEVVVHIGEVGVEPPKFWELWSLANGNAQGPAS